MVADAISKSAMGVTGAIRRAAGLTGANFEYLVATAQIESRFNPSAKAPTSSASGLFQFIDRTWLATLKQAGPAFGYDKYAAAISVTDRGEYVVNDPAMRAEIMALRNDPTANATMAGVFTRQNAARLNARLGREASEGELYIAHFLGASGASKLISTASDNPQASAADLFPRAAKANRSIFYDRQGSPRSVAQVYDALVGKYQVARAKPPGAPATATASASDPAGTAMAFAAANPFQPPPIRAGENEHVFHSLFQTGDRRDPIAPVVSELWGVPTQASAGRAKVAAAQGAPVDLAPPSRFDIFKLFKS